MERHFPLTPLFENVELNRAVDALTAKYAFVRTLLEKYGDSDGLDREQFRALFVSTFKEDFLQPVASEAIDIVNLIGESRISSGESHSFFVLVCFSNSQ
jgi:hypothetical protein